MLSFIARRTSSWPSFVLLLTVLTVLFTAFFFFLHYLGNRIPYNLALQRFQVLETDLGRKEYARGYSSTFENCQLYNSVLRGAESTSAAEGHSLYYSVFLQVYDVEDCRPVYAAISDDDPKPAALETPRVLKTYHWWGNKAILAIGLRFLSLAQFRQVVEFATYLAYGVLLVALVMLAPRAALVAVPVVVFGIFFSGIKYFSDVSNGVPYLWALLATAILSLLMKWRLDGLGGPLIVQKIGSVTALFCFVAGMVSSYLFFFEGHYIYTIVLFALVAWFGSLDRSARDRVKRVGLVVGFYIVGFVACFMLGQIVKMVVLGLPVGPTLKGFYTDSVSILQNLFEGVRNVSQPRHAVPAVGGLNLHLINGWSLFWTIGMGRVATGQALLFLSLAALTIAVFIAVLRGCRRGRWDLLWDILLILALMVFVCLSLLIPNHILGKASRVLFINYGLMWSCLILAVMKTGWRLNMIIGGLIIGPALGWLWVQSDRVDNLKSVYDQLTDDNILIQDHFTVYLDKDYRHLVYVKDECSSEDTTPEFRIRTVGIGVRGAADRQLLDDLRTFYFEDYGVDFEGKCVAQIPIIQHEIDYIQIGQDIQVWPESSYPLVAKSYNVWMSSYSGRIASYSVEYDSIAGDEPLFSDGFDVYLSKDYGSLIYVKEPCGLAEVSFLRDSEYQSAPYGFFLHVSPVDRDDLAENRRQHGFENRDFKFSTDGVLADGRCVTKVALPEYDIATIRTGQLIRYGDHQYVNLWERTSSPFGRLSPYSVEYDSIAGTDPLFRYVFDVHLSEGANSLVYVKERCQIRDVEPKFFLHIFPVDRDDLAEDRRQYEFENRDFEFSTDGVLADGRCVTKVALPEYDIATIRTGQYIYHQDQHVHLWFQESALQQTRPAPLTN